MKKYLKIFSKAVSPRAQVNTHKEVVLSQLLDSQVSDCCSWANCFSERQHHFRYEMHREKTNCLSENEDKDQLCRNCTVDQHLYIHFTDSTNPLLLKSEFSLYLLFFCKYTGWFVWTWSETPRTCFLLSWLYGTNCLKMCFVRYTYSNYTLI